jgi:DNA-directed RNA polymerase subunit RPC12/RpoP
MRLIDADELIKSTQHAGFIRRSEIEAAPTVDAEPVVHGRWVKVHGYCTPGGDPVWACSECGKGVHVYGIEHGTYGADIADDQWVSCPNCGAKMDGDGDAR